MVDLEKLEAREKVATKGTVKVCDRSDYLMRANDARWEIDEESGRERFWIALCHKEEDARLYAALRNAAPELIAELRELRALKAYINGHALSIDLPIGEWVRGVSKCSASEAVEDSIKQSPVEEKVDR